MGATRSNISRGLNNIKVSAGSMLQDFSGTLLSSSSCHTPPNLNHSYCSPLTMATFSRLIRLECDEEVQPVFANLDQDSPLPVRGEKITGFKTLDELSNRTGGKNVTLSRVSLIAFSAT